MSFQPNSFCIAVNLVTSRNEKSQKFLMIWSRKRLFHSSQPALVAA